MQHCAHYNDDLIYVVFNFKHLCVLDPTGEVIPGPSGRYLAIYIYIHLYPIPRDLYTYIERTAMPGAHGSRGF
jgi:hypothetical protein